MGRPLPVAAQALGNHSMDTVFVTSTGRTGTDFITWLVNAHVDNAWSLHEPKPAFRRRSYELRARAPTRYERLYFQWPRRWRHARRPEHWYVETNYHLHAAMHLMRACFPGALIVHIVRDGREVVRSWLNRYRYIRDTHVTPFHVPGDAAQAWWRDWNPLQKLAWYWVNVNRTAAAQGPDMWFRYETLFDAERSPLLDLLDRMPGTHYDPAAIRAAFSRPVNASPPNRLFPPYEDWPRAWREQFWEIAGEEMQRLGYA